jgi:ubiquinone/menaquinone biosynthesis C-methylase UbiE
MLRKFAARMHTREILEYLSTDDCSNIIEIGCNTGYMIDELKRFSGNVCGVDIDRSVVYQAKLKAHDVFVCDAENLAFPDDLFDAVISIHVIEHIVDIAQAIREFARILKPGGTMILIYPFEPVAGITCLPFAPLSNKCHVHLRVLKPRDLMRIVTDNSIDLRQINHVGYFSPAPTYMSVFRKKTSREL